MFMDSKQIRIENLTRDLRIQNSADDAVVSADFVALHNSIYARKISNEYFDWRFSHGAFYGNDRRQFKNTVTGSMLFAYQGSQLLGVCGYNVLPIAAKGDLAVGMVVDLMV